MDKKGKATFWIIFLVLGIILGIALSQIYVSEKGNNFQSQCYTNLQPSQYFSVSNDRLDPVFYLQNKGYTVNEIASTGSMRPTIGDDSLAISTKNFTKNDLHVGDVVIVSGYLHRIIRISDEGYNTKGDNLPREDMFLWDFEQIEGKVVGVLF